MSAYTKGTALEITSHSPWAQQFWDELIPYKDRVSQHPLFQNMASGQLSLDCFRSALLNFLSFGRAFSFLHGAGVV